jgi:hypothetical protein
MEAASVSEAPLPDCIRADAEPFSAAAMQALIVDEVGNVAGDLRGRLEDLVWSPRTLRALKWWVALSYPERQTLTAWLNRDIQ